MTESTRKLAAIVFTDIVGFTKLTADNQQKASDLLDLQRDELQPLVESHGGNWVKEVGDGLILTFDTITNAVQCCLKIQEKAKDIENLSLRIGIHLGEILEKENDVIGDDVNVAARIEPFSAPGGIAISNKVHDAIIREEGYKTKYLGKPKLKGVGQKVEVYCITSHGLPESNLSDVSAKLEPEGFQWNRYSLTGAILTVVGILFWINISFIGIGVAKESEVPSIAILPLDNKGSVSDEFYSYGISSDLISDVTSAGMLRVASLKDIEKLEYQNMENSELAKKLFVRYVAQGTLWKMDTIFQLSMEIFDTELQKVVYTKRWQTNWKDLATIKDDLSNNILETLEIKVIKDVEGQMVESDPEAYEYYLRGKHRYKKRQTADDTEIARGLIKKAMEIDDNLLEAKILLGVTFNNGGEMDAAMEIFVPVLEQAEGINNRTIVGECLVHIGSVHRKKGNYDKALEYYHRSIEISEDLGDQSGIGGTLHSIGIAQDYKGNYVDALDYLHKSYDIFERLEDKDRMGNLLNSIGIVFSNQGDYDKAIEYYKKALPINEDSGDKPGIGVLLGNIGLEYSLKGDYDMALEFYDKTLKIWEELGNKSAQARIINNSGSTLYYKGSIDKAIEYKIRALNIRESLSDSLGIAYSLSSLGQLYIYQGQNEKALESFSTAHELGMRMGNKRLIGMNHKMFGWFYYYTGKYHKAIEHLESSLELLKEIPNMNESILFSTGFLFHSYKILGKDFDKNKLKNRIEKAGDDRDSSLNFILYVLLQEIRYLEIAYDQVMEMAELMDDIFREEFLKHPDSKKIIEEYKKTVS
tara:strand:- start:10603 stop:13038 length:2436 start_codon:yes stop_codon:yes gene_type:complete